LRTHEKAEDKIGKEKIPSERGRALSVIQPGERKIHLESVDAKGGPFGELEKD